MSRKNEILGSPETARRDAARSPLKPWGKHRAVGLLGATLVMALSLSGCGQKGRLYLPEPTNAPPPPNFPPGK